MWQWSKRRTKPRVNLALRVIPTFHLRMLNRSTKIPCEFRHVCSQKMLNLTTAVFIESLVLSTFSQQPVSMWQTGFIKSQRTCRSRHQQRADCSKSHKGRAYGMVIQHPMQSLIMRMLQRFLILTRINHLRRPCTWFISSFNM